MNNASIDPAVTMHLPPLWRQTEGHVTLVFSNLNSGSLIIVSWTRPLSVKRHYNQALESNALFAIFSLYW